LLKSRFKSFTVKKKNVQKVREKKIDQRQPRLGEEKDGAGKRSSSGTRVGTIVHSSSLEAYESLGGGLTSNEEKEGEERMRSKGETILSLTQ